MGRNGQMRLSVMIVVAICATFALVALLAHTTPVIANHVARQLALYEESNGYFLYNAGYVDDGDYVLIGQLREDDHSRGGVYFIGASEMKISLMPWLMSAEERALIHNYALGDLRHRETFHFVRMLVEEWDLLSAGGDKTTIFLGLSAQMTRPKDNWRDSYVKQLFERHRLYTYDWDAGITKAALLPLEAFLRIQIDSARRFLRVLSDAPEDVRLHTMPDDAKRAHLAGELKDGWRDTMREEVRFLAETIDYLQARGVRVGAIHPPLGSWQDEFAFEATYREMVGPVLAARDVQVVDQQDLLLDEDFNDDVHANYVGQMKLHEAYLALAKEALARMGLSIADDVSARPAGS